MVPNMRPRIREGHEFDSPVGTRHLGMATHMHAHVERDVWSGLGECVPLARCRQQSKVLGGELGPLRSGRIRERRHPFGVGCKSVRHHLHKGPRKIVCVEANATKQRSARRTKTKTQEASGARGSASEGCVPPLRSLSQSVDGVSTSGVKPQLWRRERCDQDRFARLRRSSGRPGAAALTNGLTDTSSYASLARASVES